jgi:hypothetical protein
MNIKDLSNFSEVTGPTQPAAPVSEIRREWMQKFCAKIDAITPELPLMFVFHKNDQEMLLELEKAAQLTLHEMPFNAPKAQAGLFVLNNNTGGQGWHREFETIHEMQQFVRSHPTLASYPTIVGSGKESVAHFYPEGVAVEKVDTCVLLQIGGMDTLTLQGLKAALNDFASAKNLNHPNNRGRIWSEDNPKWPHKLAEKNIQSLLFLALQMRFMGGTVYAEITGPTGRTDITLEEVKNSTLVRYLIELKAVRHFSSTGATYGPAAQLKHCVDGLLQALMNGGDHSVEQALLCAYDTRVNPDNQLKIAVEKAAQVHDVEVGWYPVYSSAQQVRKAGAAALVSTATAGKA